MVCLVRGDNLIECLFVGLCIEMKDQLLSKFAPLFSFLQFNGRAEFLFTRQEMVSIVGENGLMGKELKVTGYVQDWWMNNTASSSQSAIVIDKTARIRFLEGGVITFKPGLPFQVHVSYYLSPGCELIF